METAKAALSAALHKDEEFTSQVRERPRRLMVAIEADATARRLVMDLPPLFVYFYTYVFVVLKLQE